LLRLSKAWKDTPKSVIGLYTGLGMEEKEIEECSIQLQDLSYDYQM